MLPTCPLNRSHSAATGQVFRLTISRNTPSIPLFDVWAQHPFKIATTDCMPSTTFIERHYTLKAITHQSQYLNVGFLLTRLRVMKMKLSKYFNARFQYDNEAE